MKNLILLTLLSAVFTAETQTIKQDTIYKARFVEPRIICSLTLV